MAAPTTGSPRPTRSNGVIPTEWPVQAADLIVDTIGKVRDKTTKPALTAARGVVYGLVGLVVGTIAAVLFLLALIRLYDNYVPGNIWPLYAGLAVVFLGSGLWALKQAKGPAAPAS